MQANRRAWLPTLCLTGAICGALTLGLNARLSAQEDAAASDRASAAQAAGEAARQLDLETESFRAVVSEDGGGLAHYILKDPRYVRDGKPIDIVTTDKSSFLPLRQRLEGVEGGNAPLRWKAERIDTGLRLKAQVGGVSLTRKLEPGDGDYQLWSTLRVRNNSDAKLSLKLIEEGHHYIPREKESGGFIASRSPFLSSGTCYVQDTIEHEDREEIVESVQEGEPLVFSGPAAFGAVDNVYFTQAVAAHGEKYEKCALLGSDRGGSPDSPHGSLLDVELTRSPTELAPGEEHVYKTLYYLGPKTPDHLAAAGHQLRAANDVGGVPGINTIAQGLAGLLKLIHSKVGNWGLAIILLTFVVKLVLYPLTAKSFESMAAMRRLKPEIDALNEKFANDREKKGAAMMELYRKHKINPLGGCLPQLLQLPIWWALYMSLSTNVELFRQPFVGFWTDLTSPDPYYVLPLGLGVLMFVQQKLTPTTVDPAQAKMMLYMMPTMITAFMLFLPAGLCLYMFTNSVLTIGQQRVIEYRLNNKQADAAPAQTEEAPAPAAKVDSTKRRKRRGRA